MFTKSNIQGHRDSLRKEFEEVGKKLGLNLTFNNITFSDTEFHFTLLVTENSPEAEKARKEETLRRLKDGLKYSQEIYNLQGAALIEAHAKIDALTVEDVFEKVFILSTGKEFNITGYNVSADKFPVEIELKSGLKQTATIPFLIKYLNIK